MCKARGRARGQLNAVQGGLGDLGCHAERSGLVLRLRFCIYLEKVYMTYDKCAIIFLRSTFEHLATLKAIGAGLLTLRRLSRLPIGPRKMLIRVRFAIRHLLNAGKKV